MPEDWAGGGICMIIRYFIVALTFILSLSAAEASTCPSVTNIFQNGNTADATQVNTNFSGLVNCANNVLVGTTTNDNAPAGNNGEYVSSSVAKTTPVTLVSATPANLTSVSLSAGDWDCSADIISVTGYRSNYYDF
jgi:hypothetical protein